MTYRGLYPGLPANFDPWESWPPGPTAQRKAELLAELELELLAKPNRYVHNRCHIDPCVECEEP